MSPRSLVFKFDKKVQKEVSQLANCNLPVMIPTCGLSVNLDHLNNSQNFEKLKSSHEEYIFTPLCQFMAQNSNHKYP